MNVHEVNGVNEISDPLRLLQTRVRIVLVAPRYAGNIGSSARAMKTMGLRDLVLVSPIEHLAAEATWRAVHASDVLTNARVTDSLAEATADCVFVVGTSGRERHLPLPVLEPRAAALAMLQAALRGPVAVIFGNETSGLSGEDLARCNLHVRIPTDPEYSSLNLAMAVQLLSYELRMAALAVSSQSKHELVVLDTALDTTLGTIGHSSSAQRELPTARSRGSRALATAAQLAHLMDHVERVLLHIGFHNPAKPRLLLQRLRRLFARAQLESAETHLLRGILASVERAAERREVKHEQSRGGKQQE